VSCGMSCGSVIARSFHAPVRHRRGLRRDPPTICRMHTYTVQVFRDNGFWILEVPELRAVGQARALRVCDKIT
jgi:hypothetical protein